MRRINIVGQKILCSIDEGPNGLISDNIITQMFLALVPEIHDPSTMDLITQYIYGEKYSETFQVLSEETEE
jgi:hypothetical protein